MATDSTTLSALEAMTAAADYLAELYAKYQLKIGPFASQAQKIQGRLRAAIASAEARAADLAIAASMEGKPCSDCPPVGAADTARCLPCPRRGGAAAGRTAPEARPPLAPMIRGLHLRHTGGGALELWRDDAMVRYFGRFDGEFRDRDALIVAYNDQHDNAPPDQPSSAAQREYDRREYDRCMADFN